MIVLVSFKERENTNMFNKNTIKKETSVKLGVAGLLIGAAVSLVSVANADSYTVQSGDTLSTIASSHNTTVDQLVLRNNIANANQISVGQVLELDATTSTTTTSASTDQTTTASSATASTSSTLSAADAAAKEEIAQRESSGSYTAQNGQYYGRYQLSLPYLNGDLSAENQERVADAYVTSRYGSWSAALSFWNANGWY